jgi:hypothetical protein
MFSFLGKQRARNIAVVDLSSTSAAAAYATYSGIAPPQIIFSAREPAEAYGSGAAGSLRALDAVAREMTSKGAPLLRKVTGTGSVEEVILLLGDPWQKTSLSIKIVEKDKPFIFTKSLLTEAVPSGSRATIVSTVLNGYDSPEPVGKKVKRAEIAVLSSTTDGEVERLAKRAIRTFTGAAPLSLLSFPEAATAVLKGFFPHERDFLALRIGNETTEIAFVRDGYPAGVETAATGAGAFSSAAGHAGVSSAGVAGIIDREKSGRLETHMQGAEQAWVTAMHDAFLKVAAEGALPRTLFLFADEEVLPLFKRLLDAPDLHTLWLSDEPLSVIPMQRGSLSASMRKADDQLEDDVVLDVLCLTARTP